MDTLSSASPLAIVLLGSTNDENGALSSFGIERCQQAIREHQAHPGARIVLTGAWGDHFNTTARPHHLYLREYLLAQGIPAEDIAGAVDSSNTIQDAALSRPLIERHGFRRLIVVTSDFHLPRAQFLFQREFPHLELAFSGSFTVLPPDELTRRLAHEKQALARLLLERGIAAKY